ncbi:MAG: response regulator transcription factor [Bacteroidetes bacterium]|nr:response regulator transcription factor [Bacteroidota bacterium]
MIEFKILIVEDEPLIAEDIAFVLKKNDYHVSGIAYYEEDAYVELEKNPDMVLLDINLNGIQSGIRIAEIINEKYQLPFIYLTSYSDKYTIEKAKHTEPSGYLVKPFSDAGLYSAIEIALFNHAQKIKQKFPELSLSIINKHLQQPISDREFELLNLIYNGKTNQQIADTMFISVNTVKKHINHIYLKIESTSRTQTMNRLRELMKK